MNSTIFTSIHQADPILFKILQWGLPIKPRQPKNKVHTLLWVLQSPHTPFPLLPPMFRLSKSAVRYDPTDSWEDCCPPYPPMASIRAANKSVQFIVFCCARASSCCSLCVLFVLLSFRLFYVFLCIIIYIYMYTHTYTQYVYIQDILSTLGSFLEPWTFAWLVF